MVRPADEHDGRRVETGFRQNRHGRFEPELDSARVVLVLPKRYSAVQALPVGFPDLSHRNVDSGRLQSESNDGYFSPEPQVIDESVERVANFSPGFRISDVFRQIENEHEPLQTSGGSPGSQFKKRVFFGLSGFWTEAQYKASQK